MRWSTLVAAVGVVAGAAFAAYDEAQNLLAQCEAQSQDWYARVLILALLFSMHCMVLSAGAYAILRLSPVGKGTLKRLAEVATVVVVALAVGFCVAIVDPVLNYLVAVSCTALEACSQDGFADSLMRGAQVAADWPNTPVAVFMVSLFGMGAFLVQEVTHREHNASVRRGVA
jgi:hypothetical protein